MKIKKTTALVVVEAIEPLLPYWRDKRGYGVTVEVPHGDHVGFVILVRDGSELMLQTIASVKGDLPKLLPTFAKRPVGFFHEVEGLDSFVKSFPTTEVQVGPRTTDYGMREIWVVDPEGFVHGYAERA